MFSIKNRQVGCAAVALALLAGCGKADKAAKLDLTPVSGTITLDGKPLADADVGFSYLDVAPAGFFGSAARTDSQGRYELQTGDKKGAPAGSYRVVVSRVVARSGVAIKPEEGLDLAQLSAAGEVTQTVPAKYTEKATTDLQTTVEKGKADGYNFDLKSQ
ncbi:MAG TPA: hypothetical protein VFW87_20330 [Pirellulales bacterium]|nr:hypothetical protein [Pirellulales bacterium]